MIAKWTGDHQQRLPFVGEPSNSTVAAVAAVGLCMQRIDDIPDFLQQIDEAGGVNRADPDEELEDLSFLRQVVQPYI